MTFGLNQNRWQVRWLTSGLKYTGEELFTLFSVMLLLAMSGSPHPTPTPKASSFFFLLSIFFSFPYLPHLWYFYKPSLFVSNVFALFFSMCVCVSMCVSGIEIDLFIVVTLAVWSLKAVLLSRAKTLARSAHLCLLFEHYLPYGAFKSTSAKHHLQAAEKKEWKENRD